MTDIDSQQSTSAETDAINSGASKARLLIAIGAVLGAILVNLGLAFAFIPTAEEIEAQKRIIEGWDSKSDPQGNEDETEQASDTPKKDASQQEEPLGEFNISAFQPLSSTTIRIDFKLWGIVEAEEVGGFREQYAKNENRVREQILIIMRSADIDDLSEAGLGLIKRKILDKTNHLLSKPFIKSVHFSNFSFVEQ